MRLKGAHYFLYVCLSRRGGVEKGVEKASLRQVSLRHDPAPIS